MINVLIGLLNNTLVDYTNKLIESDDITLSLERERGTFDRVTDDIHLQFSNKDNTFTTLFKNGTANSRYVVHVLLDTTYRFRGEIDFTSVEFDSIQQTVSMNVFSLEKQFWEYAKRTKVKCPTITNMFNESSGYTTVRTVLNAELLRAPFSTLFSVLNISSLYTSRPIRNRILASEATDQKIGNYGRIKELNPDMKVSELLEAMCIFYNAEFYIDAVTGYMNMSQRNAILSVTNTNIDNDVKMDEGITIMLADEEKYDYIAMTVKYPKPDPMSYVSETTGLVTWPAFGYVVSSIVDSAGIEIESEISNELLHITGYTYVSAHQTVFNVPLGRTGTTRRKIYRRMYSNNGGESDFTPVGDYRYVGEIGDNVTTTFTDNNPLLTTDILNTEQRQTTMWMGYDESTGQWNTPIVDDGSSDPPSGKIYEAMPKLEFVAINDSKTKLQVSLSDIADFFGGFSDFDLQQYRNQWYDLMISRRKLILSVKRTDLKVGDQILCTKSIHGIELLKSTSFLIRRTEIKVMNESSRLELLVV